MSVSEETTVYLPYGDVEAEDPAKGKLDEACIYAGDEKVQKNDTGEPEVKNSTKNGKSQSTQGNSIVSGQSNREKCKPLGKNSPLPISGSDTSIQQSLQSDSLSKSTSSKVPSVKQVNVTQTSSTKNQGRRRESQADCSKASSSMSPGRSTNVTVPNNVEKITLRRNSKVNNAENETANLELRHSGDREKLLSTNENINLIPQDKISAIKTNKLTTVSQEKAVCQIKTINDLKKATPRVKFLTDEPKSLTEFRKLHSSSTTNPPTHSIKKTVQTKALILEETRQQLKKYCRTCAGLKLPLVDIFSKKGMQMRLNQQMKHLEVINQQDSLSTQMCMDCICDLKMSYKFFMQIKKAEVKLKSIYISLADANANEIKSRNLNVDKIPISGPSCTIKEDPDKSTESLRDLLSGANEVNVDDSIPKISAIFSLQDLQETPKSSDDMNFEINIKTEPEEHEEYPPFNQSDDNDSIEEFDPEDPPFQVDSSDAGESEDELESRRLQNFRNSQIVQMQQTTELAASIGKSIASSSNPPGQDFKKDNKPMIYKYDTLYKSYVKVDTLEKDEAHSNTTDTLKSKIDSDNHGHLREGQTHPNILKRKLPLLIKKEPHPDTDVSSDALDILNSSGGLKDSKMQKLNVQNALNIGTPEEEGIMYVTVKGSKPNELLLVKVKKMDKNIDKKDEKSLSKKTVDVKPVDKILKKYENLTNKEKDLFPERFKKTDIREQIIEEQIEEYKKKREKVLGGTAVGFPNALKLEDGQVRFVKQNDNQNLRRSLSTDNNLMIKKDSVKGNEDKKPDEVDLKDVIELTETLEDKSPGDKTYVNTEEYLSRLAKLKQKWEEAKKKKESLQKELDQSYTEGNMEKLARILGEREQNLQDFQDYLKQRKIVITRLKDEDIISLYEDRNNTTLKKSLPDLIDESQPLDYIPEENFLECDYCPETFATKEALEEHLKSHDYKIMHYCEDCMEEFPTNKAKRNHNISCLKKLICKYCDFMLDSKGKKRQHEQKHCDSMDGQLCDICGEKFKHQGTLDQHIKTQHMSWEKIFQCPKCPKKFAFKQKLSFHLKSVHTTLRAYLCEDCGADFKNPASLRHHRIRKHQPVGNKRECPVCHKLVPFYSLSKHMHTHKAYTIQCPHCDKMFKNSSTLKQHVRIHEDQRQFRCDTCGVGFNRRDGLRLHMRVHEKTDSRGLKECSCQVCGEKFPNHSMLVIHRNRVHKDGRQYTCHICNRSMISTRSLEWHMSHIHNESLPGTQKDDGEIGSEKKRVTCCHCNKTFKTEMILRTHIKNTHMEKDPLKCTECEETFTSDIRLRHHMMVIHNRLEGTLECPHCPKRFVNHLRLKTHMISHSEERPYTCEICGFNLKTKIQLIKHHQNRHSDERPLQCRYCPWRCKQVSALVCHERTHTNERPYSCSVCRQRFKYLGDKNKHERRHESLGGSGFKRIVAGRNIKQIKVQEEETSSSQDPEDFDQGQPSMHTEEDYSSKFDEDQIIKYEAQDIEEESYEQSYEPEYEETSREASDETAEVIMSMEDTTVYTEEVTADNIETAEMIADEMMTSQILQSGTVVHLQQQDDSGKIQVIPVMLSLPDLTDSNAEVNLATASIMYNN